MASNWKKPTPDELKAGVQNIATALQGQELGPKVPTISLPQSYGPDYDFEAVQNQPDPTPEDIYGAPEGWDWRTADKDWDGDPLPEGAKGFDKYGYPFYGTGLTGVWNKIKAMWKAPTEDTGKDWFQIKRGTESENVWNFDPNKETRPVTGVGEEAPDRRRTRGEPDEVVRIEG